MENGAQTPKKGGKNGEAGGNLPPIGNGKKGRKIPPKKGKLASFPFFLYLAVIFSHFRSGAIFHRFPHFFLLFLAVACNLIGRPSTKSGMSHLCDSMVAGPDVHRDNVLASRCKYPPFRYPWPRISQFNLCCLYGIIDCAQWRSKMMRHKLGRPIPLY